MPHGWFFKRRFRAPFLCLLFLLPAHHSRAQGNAANCSAEHFNASALIQSVTDGDTLRLKDGRKLRLIGINTPELAHDDRPAEPLADEAKAALRQLFREDKTVRLLYGIEENDRYGRLLAHAFLADGQNIQALLLQQGLARSIAFPPNTRLADCYSRQEKIARCRKIGLWRNQGSQNVTELNRDDSGFRLVKGKISGLNINHKGIWLNMENRLTIGIRPENRTLFDLDELGKLLNQVVVVRGWLSHSNNKKYRNPFYIRVRHPSSLQPWGAFSCQ